MQRGGGRSSAATCSAVLLVLLLAVPAPARRVRYYDDAVVQDQQAAPRPVYRRRLGDQADVWEGDVYEDAARPAPLTVRREYRPYWPVALPLADDAVRAPRYQDDAARALRYQDDAVRAPRYQDDAVRAPRYQDDAVRAPRYQDDAVRAPRYQDDAVRAPRYQDDGLYVRRRVAAAPTRSRADDAYAADPYRYAVRWVPVRVDDQDDVEDAPPWPERRGRDPASRRLPDLPVDDMPRRGRRPVEAAAAEQAKPSRRPPVDATTEDAATAKPLNVHLWLSVDQKSPLLVPGVLQVGQAPPSTASPAPSPTTTTTPPPPPPPRKAVKMTMGRSSSAEGRGADDGPGKHIVINNYYQNHAAPGHDAGAHGGSGAADDAAASTELPAGDDDQGAPEQSGDVPPPAPSDATAPAVHVDTTTATARTASTAAAANAADTVEPLADSDLETYLGSELRDADEAKPSAHSGHRTASPVHVPPHQHQHTKKKAGRAGGSSAAPGRYAAGRGAPAGFSGKKRCFSIVLEDKVKRYKETPC